MARTKGPVAVAVAAGVLAVCALSSYLLPAAADAATASSGTGATAASALPDIAPAAFIVSRPVITASDAAHIEPPHAAAAKALTTQQVIAPKARIPRPVIAAIHHASPPVRSAISIPLTPASRPHARPSRPNKPTSDYPAPSDDLVTAAIRYDRSHGWGGQCKGFVQMMHTAAGRGSLGIGYYSAYPDSGYVEVPMSEAARGDIVQFYFNSTSTEHGIHTAILLGPVTQGTADVIDSNWVGSEIVGEHNLDILGRVDSISGLKVAIWRYAG